MGAPWRTLEAHGCPLEDRRSDAAAVLKKLLHDGGVGQGGNVAQVPLVAGDLTEHPPHYLPWEGGGRERDRRREMHIYTFVRRRVNLCSMSLKHSEARECSGTMKGKRKNERKVEDRPGM